MSQRLTINWSNDVDPAWSLDGKLIVFTSDRIGTPQFFILDIVGDENRRLAYNGNYDTSPD